NEGGAFTQHWGAMSIEAQERGLMRLGGDMSTEFFMRDGMLFTRSVGETSPRLMSQAFMGGWARGSWRMGTVLNDIRPRNMGVNGIIFDPALDSFMQSIFMTGVYGATRPTMVYVDHEIPE